MKNKVLVKLIIPELGENYDVFLPVNEFIWKIKKLLLKAVCDIAEIELTANIEYVLMNKINCKIYENNEALINTDIRNGTELILFSKV